MAQDGLDQVLIGGREPRRIVIVDYDPSWPERFEAEQVKVAAALGQLAQRIEHIGSTAVPDLPAKPIVDLLVAVEDPEHERLVALLEPAGYRLRVREPGHRMFRTLANDVHVHIWAAGDPEIERYLRFRDQLRASADDRAAYAQLKRALAQREWPDVTHYADAKGPFIESLLARVSP